MTPENKAQPLYKQIYESLANEIQTGRLSPQARLPSEQELCNRFGVSKITVKKALSGLAQDGLIERIPGKGSFVQDLQGPGRVSAPVDAPQLIAFVIDDFGAAFGNSLVYSIEEECAALGYRMILFRSRNLPEREERAIADALRLGVSGLIVEPVHGEFYSNTYLKLVVDEFPLVFVGNYLAGLAASHSGTDNFQAAREATSHLFDLGHDQIAFMSPRVENTYSIEKRRDGFVQAHSDRGMVVNSSRILEDLDSATLAGRSDAAIAVDIDRIRRFLRENPACTAVFAEEYSVAELVRTAAEHEGRSVPDSLSILSFDSPSNWIGEFPFSHMRQRENELGHNAVQLLHRRITRQGPIEQILLPADLKTGRSTAPVTRRYRLS